MDPVDIPVHSPRPLALLVPIGSRAARPHAVLQPFMVLRNQGRPYAVLLVSSRNAWIRTLSGSVVTVNEEACAGGRELKTGDRVGLGPLRYEFRRELPQNNNGHARLGGCLAVGDVRVEIERPIILIGGGEGADVRLDAGLGSTDIGVVLELEEGRVLVSLASPPAFAVNGLNRSRHVLAEGDVIQVRGQSIRYTENKEVVEDSFAAAAAPRDTGEWRPPARGIACESPPPVVQCGAERPGRSDPLKSWGPLARAVISAEAFLEVDAAVDERDAGLDDRSARRRWWPLILVLVFLVASVAALAWWLRDRT